MDSGDGPGPPSGLRKHLNAPMIKEKASLDDVTMIEAVSSLSLLDINSEGFGSDHVRESV